LTYLNAKYNKLFCSKFSPLSKKFAIFLMISFQGATALQPTTNHIGHVVMHRRLKGYAIR